MKWLWLQKLSPMRRVNSGQRLFGIGTEDGTNGKESSLPTTPKKVSNTYRSSLFQCIEVIDQPYVNGCGNGNGFANGHANEVANGCHWSFIALPFLFQSVHHSFFLYLHPIEPHFIISFALISLSGWMICSTSEALLAQHHLWIVQRVRFACFT